MLATLNQVVEPYVGARGAVAAFNVFGYEDATAVVHAAEQVNLPVILATNRVALDHIPIDILGQMLTLLADKARVPVCVHLDHGKDLQTVIQAIHAGYCEDSPMPPVFRLRRRSARWVTAILR